MCILSASLYSSSSAIGRLLLEIATPLDLQLPWLEATCIHYELASLTWYYVHLITLLSTLRLPIPAFIREPFDLKYNLFSVLHDLPIAISTNLFFTYLLFLIRFREKTQALLVPWLVEQL